MDDGGGRFLVDDLLDFNLEAGEIEDEIVEEEKARKTTPSCSEPSDDRSFSLPECMEEELEWLSNKDAFPSVETYFDLLANNQDSPNSVLENIKNGSGCYTRSFACFPVQYPMKARSKRRRRHGNGFPDVPSNRCLSGRVEKSSAQASSSSSKMNSVMGRKCQHCGADKTPQWRAGPKGPKTLCNACGVRFKSGRLVPEYRPASSPSYSALLHSNSHRKIVEMRRQKQVVVDM